MNCFYCDHIAAANSAYAPRDATYDTGSEAPRCAWHWRMLCDHCGEAGHYMTRFYCPRSDQLLCRAAGAPEVVYGDFWGRGYWWVLPCPHCGERHPSLDYAEYAGIHPWQLHPEMAEARRWLSAETELRRYPPERFPDVEHGTLTDADTDRNWSSNADTWDAGYDEDGDRNRKYSSDAVLMEFLGEVGGKRVLDAGSGNGYLSRRLARMGARVVAVENAERFHELALRYQEREPLDITFHHGSISAMPYLEDAGFDAVVANYVLMDVRDYEGAVAEIARVLRPGGIFVFSLARNTTAGRWYWPAPDSPRREDRAGFLDDDYFVRRPGYVQWGAFKPILSFNRPLRDYIATCKHAGLALRDLDEPFLTEEAQRIFPAPDVREAQRLAVSYVLKTEKV